MKVSELPANKAGLLGTRIARMKNLAVHGSFPELVLKRAYDVQSAVQFGGIMINCGAEGLLFFACQDPKQLLDLELTYPNGGKIEVKPNGSFWTRDDGLTYFKASMTGSDVSKSEPAKVLASDIVNWCAVFTPCEGYGHAGSPDAYYYTEPGSNDLTLSIGPIAESGSVQWGTGASQVTLGGRNKSALILWREVPLRKTLKQIATRPGFYDDLVSHYPIDIQEDAKRVAADELAKIGDAPVSVMVSYCRGQDDKIYVGLGASNAFSMSVGSSSPYGIAVHAYGTVPRLETSDFPEPDVTYTRVDGLSFDCGFRSETPSGGRQWNHLVQPRPDYGWSLGEGVVPLGIQIDQTEINMRGLLKDFMPTKSTAYINTLLNDLKVSASTIPSLAIGGDTENQAGDQRVGQVTTRESTHNEDYITHVSNVLARVDVELGDGTAVHKTSNRIWQGTAADMAKAPSPRTFIIQFPGAKWSSGSMAGGRLRAALEGNVTFEQRTVTYAGLVYTIVDAYRGAELVKSFADAGVGSAPGKSYSLDRGVTAFEGVNYGSAATSSSPPQPGIILVSDQQGIAKVSEIVPVA